MEFPQLGPDVPLREIVPVFLTVPASRNVPRTPMARFPALAPVPVPFVIANVLPLMASVAPFAVVRLDTISSAELVTIYVPLAAMRAVSALIGTKAGFQLELALKSPLTDRFQLSVMESPRSLIIARSRTDILYGVPKLNATPFIKSLLSATGPLPK